MVAKNLTNEVLVQKLHGKGLSDTEISDVMGVARSSVQRIRSRLGLPALKMLVRPKPPRPDHSASPKRYGGGVTPVRTQMDRFLAAFERVDYAPPEESERAKEAGRHGRLPAAPAVPTFTASSLERY